KVDFAENIVVLKTYSGMAQAAAAAIDALQMQDIVGSVAGDDTILIVMRSAEIARDFSEKYKEILH
ncbi:MAG: arginine repressor, partial [Eubacteriales bacterium]